MLYALNLFNLIPDKEDQYRRYSVLAGKIIYRLGGKVVAAGCSPLRYMHGDLERKQMIVVQFPGEAPFQQFLDEAQREDIHALREGATSDYIWTLFQPWDLRAWVKENQAGRESAEAAREVGVAHKATLVLLPGLLCDGALWEPQISALSAICEPWVADLTRDNSLKAMAERVLAEAPAQRFALAGLSMGGYVAMEMLRLAADRVTRLALLDTRARPDEPEETERRMILMRLAQSERGFTPVTERLLPLLVHPSRTHDEPLIGAIRQMAERIGVQAYLRQQHAIISRPDFRHDLRTISCPTLVLCGREDALTPLAFHQEIAAAVPNARLVILEQCGHLSTLERPAEVNTALRTWLTQ